MRNGIEGSPYVLETCNGGGWNALAGYDAVEGAQAAARELADIGWPCIRVIESGTGLVEYNRCGGRCRICPTGREPHLPRKHRPAFPIGVRRRGSRVVGL